MNSSAAGHRESGESSNEFEELVAAALEALDRGGDAALAVVLDSHPAHRDRVVALVARFRTTGLLARDARSDLPERLGEFRLLQRLGGGGMGVVFLAEQESLQRVVALKVVRPDLLFFAGTRERFRREIEIVARLAHPAIVPIVATGEHDAMPWYAMQRIDGCSADEVVRRLQGRDPTELRGADLRAACSGVSDPQPPDEQSVFAGTWWEACTRLVRQAALGLDHAHRQGVVHRDVKPSNIMLTPDGRAMLLDFGLARGHGDPKLTRTGGEPGSPAYMAPEQVRGVAADERADVYSLAATLFQLLDLEAPFVAPGPEPLRAMILAGRADGPRNRALPYELRLVLAVAMDVDRERRYATAEAFADDLAAVLARRPIQARPLPRRVRFARWTHRHRTATAVLAAMLLLALVLPSALAWQQASSLAAVRLEKQNTERNLGEAMGAVSKFLTRFASSELGTMPGGRRISRDLLEEALRVLDRIGATADPALVRQHRTHAARWLVASLRAAGRHAEARAKALETLALWPDDAVRTPSMSFLLASLRAELVHLAADGVVVENVDDHRVRADAELANAATDPRHAPEVRKVRSYLASTDARLQRVRGDTAAALAGMSQAVTLLREADGSAGSDRPTLAVMQNRYGDLLREERRFADAAAQFEATLALLTPPIDRALGRPEDVRLRAYAVWGLARIAMGEKRWPDALRHMEAARELYETTLFSYPEDLGVVASVGSVLAELAQVKRHLRHPIAEVDAMLDRSCTLFRVCGDWSDLDATTRHGRIVALVVSGEQLVKAKDPERLSAVAREIARGASDDAMRQAMVAWWLLQCADWYERGERFAAAVQCEDDAMQALLACEAAGWFAPVDLDDAPCRRLADRAEFGALQSRHPASQVSRQPPK